MKTLIVYSSKYGCAKDLAVKLSEKLSGEVVVRSVENTETLNVLSFDQIILGSSIYIGQIGKKLKAYIEKNMTSLLKKKVGLFIACVFIDKANEVIKTAFPKELFDHATSIECFGGEIRKDEMSFLHKKAVAMLEKQVNMSQVTLMPENIDKMAKAMN